MSDNENRMLVLIGGESGTGKSASLANLRDPERVLYANCEANKRLPFKSKFAEEPITDPYQIFDLLDQVIEQPDAVSAFVIDTLTFLMNMYESVYVIGAANTQKAWGDYFQYFQELMQQKIAKAKVPILVLGHTRTDLHEDSGEYRTQVPVKGALKNTGVESFFSTVVATKKMRLKDLEPYANDMLTITEDDEIVGYKHVFQTRITKKTVGERIRAPMGMWTKEQTFIDNDAQKLLDHMFDYYV